MLNVENLVIKDYKEYLEEQEIKHSEETLKTYIDGLYYELLDNIDVECENFSVPSELDSIQAIEYIENEIERIIKKYYSEVERIIKKSYKGGNDINDNLYNILKVIENNELCIIFKVRENMKMELIKLGYFKGNEEMIRITKPGDTHTITIFYNNGESISYDFGRSTTCVSEPLKQIRFIMENYIKEKYNINLK